MSDTPSNNSFGTIEIRNYISTNVLLLISFVINTLDYTSHNFKHPRSKMIWVQHIRLPLPRGKNC